MQITVNIKDGSTAEGIARALRFQANLLDGIEPKKAASNAMTGPPTKKGKVQDEDEEETEDENDSHDTSESDDDSDEDDSADDDTEEETDDDTEEETDDDTEEETDEPVKKKLTAKEEKMLKEVNAALRTRAKKTSFDKVKVWLKKKFKVSSITGLKPAQYAAVIKAAKAV